MSPSAGELFLRYRERADLEALARAFDRTAPELTRLARRLTSARADAEDLVQATFLQALESAETFDGSRPLEPWLVGILVNRARALARRRSRVPEEDRLRRPGPPGPAEAAEEAELQCALRDALERLPEPYRSVVDSHVLGGKSGGEIALELGRRPSTVRVQLARGLARLRRVLSAGFAASGFALTFGPRARALARTRHLVLTQAGAGSAALPASPLWTLGGLAMAKKAAVWIVLAVSLAAALWWTTRPDAPLGIEGTHAAPVDVLAADEGPTTTALPALEPPEADRRPDEARARARTASAGRRAPHLAGARGRLVEADGTPVPNMPLALLELDTEHFQRRLMEGDPVAGLRPGPLVAMTETDEEGRFELHGARSRSAHALAADPGGERSALLMLERALQPGEATDLGDVYMPVQVGLHGTVVDELGRPVAGARVRSLAAPPALSPEHLAGLQDLRPGHALLVGRGDDAAVVELPPFVQEIVEHLPLPSTTTDEHGRFHLVGHGDEVLVLVDEEDHFGLVEGPLSIVRRSSCELGTLRLTRGRTLQGRVVDAQGAPVADARTLGAFVDPRGELALLKPGGRTDADGRFSVHGLAPDGRPIVAVQRAEGAEWEVCFEPEEESPDAWRVVLERRTALTLRLVDHAGDPVEDAEVWWAVESDVAEDDELGFLAAFQHVARPASPGPGLFRVDGVPARDLVVFLRSSAGYASVEAEPGEEPVEVRFPEPLVLAVDVVDAQGAPVAGALVSVMQAPRDRLVQATAVTDAAGLAQLPPASPPGDGRSRLFLLVQHERFAAHQQPLEQRAGTERLRVRLTRGARIDGRLTVGGRAPRTPLMVGLRKSEEVRVLGSRIGHHTLTGPDGTFRFDDVPPGEYAWEVAERFLDEELVGVALSGEMDELYDLDKGHIETCFARGELVVPDEPVVPLEIDLLAEDLPAYATITGRVLVHGRPRAALQLELRGPGPDRFARTDASGTFRFEEVPAGEVRVRVPSLGDPRDRRALRKERTVLAEPGREYRVDFDLEPSELALLVRDATTGQPVTRAMCELRLEEPDTEGDGGRRDRSETSGRTDSGGRCLLSSQVGGTYTYRVYSDGYAFRHGEVVLDPRAGTTSVTVDLEPSVPCAGTVDLSALAGGETSRRMRLDVYCADTGERVETTRITTASPGFRFDRLGPGAYEVELRQDRTRSARQRFELDEDGVTDLVLEASP